MGQQQLHLLVLGFILVSIAFVVGLDSFQSNAVESNRDAVIMDLNNLAGYAQLYYRKTTTYGGGNNSFIGYDLPAQLKENDNGSFTLISTQPQKVIIEGVGKEKSGSIGCNQSEYITYRITVEPNQTSLKKIN